MTGLARFAPAILVLTHLGLASPVQGTQAPVAPPEVRYRLHATVDDQSGLVTGSAEIRYQHLASDTLRSLTFLLGHNAFRSGARAWPAGLGARADAAGFERVSDFRLDGVSAALAWPQAPDSSVVVVPLLRALAAGDSVLITLAWTARPPATGPRVDRRGRRINLMGWYPQLLDMTSPTTVPFPAFATLLLTLDLSQDQVIGGTGVPRCGDPGWAGARAFVDTRVTLQRDWYPRPRDALAATASCDGAGPGRKRLVWYAEDVTQLDLAMRPSFRYEEGDFLEKPVRALYEPGDERNWGAGRKAPAVVY